MRRALTGLKYALLGYCIVFTVTSYAFPLLGIELPKLRERFVGLLFSCVFSFLFNIESTFNNKGEYDYRDGKLIFVRNEE